MSLVVEVHDAGCSIDSVESSNDRRSLAKTASVVAVV